MSFVGTFGMFTTVRMGIYTSQKGLNLTGNNIANINTIGYTRQTLDIKSMSANGVDRYSDSNVRIGSGAYAYGVSQLRDPYLDIRYRTECASVGFTDTKLSHLNDIAAIIDEVGAGDDQNGIIAAQFSKFATALQNLSEYTGQGEFDTQARSSATALVHLFNSYANKLSEVEANAVRLFNSDLNKVNEILGNIRDLNTHIRKCDIHGSPALEMRDERNNLIDELSQYIKIDVEYTTENIGPAVDVERMTIKIADTYPSVYLIDGIYGTQLEQSDLNPDYDPEKPDGPGNYPYLDKNGNPTDISNFDLRLTELTDNKGNLKTTYKYTTNEINALTDIVDKNGNQIFVYDEDGNPYTNIEQLFAGGSNTYTWNVADDDPDDGLSTQYILNRVVDEENNSTKYILTAIQKKESIPIELGDNTLYGALQASREFLTECGEFATKDYIDTVDENAATKRGVRYYKNALDLLAKKFADSMNAANTSFRYTHDHADNKYYYVDGAGNFILDENGNRMEKDAETDLSEDQIAYLERHSYAYAKNEEDGKVYYVDSEGKPISSPDGNGFMEWKAPNDLTDEELQHLRENGFREPAYLGNLFSTSGDNDIGEGITAANISISHAWASGEARIVNSYAVISGSNVIPTTDNTNILHMIHLMDKDMSYSPDLLVPGTKTDSFFDGSFSEMLGNISAVLGNDQSSTQILLDNYYASAVELDTGRDAVSSVDLNDETVNMIQYQKSYSAACRLMTALDETIDKLINGTGVAGR